VSTLLGGGINLRNSANSANVGGFSRRGSWEGNSNYDPAIWAETGYGLYFYTDGSATTKMSLSTGGNLTVLGTLSASGYNKTNWDTAYGWGNHASAGYVPQARTITINGTSYDLSANRSWTVSGTETDTLATVTARGATANSAISVRNGYNIIKSDGVTAGGQLYYDSSINQLYLWNSVSSGYFSVYTNSAERLNISSGGAVTANVDMRAPIYYDSNNTGYYIDPAGNSSLYYASFANDVQMNGNYLRFDQSGTRSWNIRAASGNLNFSSGDGGGTYVFNGGTSFSNSSSWFGGYGPGSGPGLAFENQNTFARIVFWGLDFYDWNHGTQMVIDNGYVSANNSFRAPTFYDSNNTGYYIDGASTSNLNVVNANMFNGKITILGGTSSVIGQVQTSSSINLGIAANAYGYGISTNNSGGLDIMANQGSQPIRFWSGSINESPTKSADFNGTTVTFYGNTTSSEYYVNGWFRNNSNNTGLYNQANANHFYSRGPSRWGITGNSTGSDIFLDFYANHQTTYRGSVHADTGNSIGFLTDNGGWGLRVTNNKSVYIHGTDLHINADNAGSSNIIMRDGDHGDRQIHCNSNRIGFLNQGGGWGSWCEDNGSWINETSMNSPVFYDYNDTGYYLDPASNSRLYRMLIHRGIAGGGQNIFSGLEGVETANGRGQLVISSSYSDLVIASSQANNQHGSTLTFATYNPDNRDNYRKFVINQGNWGSRNHMLSFGYGDGNYTNPHSVINNTMNTLTLDGFNRRVGIKVEDPGYALEVSGDVYSSSSRAGIFYRNTDTAYWWQPANDGSHRFQTPSGYIDIGPKNAGHCHIYTDRSNFYFNQTLLVNGNTVLHEGNYSSYAWPLQGTWKPTSLSSSTRLRGATSPDGGEFGLAYSGGQIHPYADGFFYQNEGAYRVIDTNSFSSYALPLSGGTMSGQMLAPSVGTGVYDGAIQLRETGYVGNTQYDWGYAPAITFHWGNRHAKKFGMRSDGLFAVNDVPIVLANGGTWSINIAGNATTVGSATVNTLRGGVGANPVNFTVDGDANTYYPVIISPGGQYGFNRYSVYRGYSETAPWDPIGTGVHKGGLTFTFEWSSDIAWGGNDKAYRVIEFSENYTTMVAGMTLPVTEGIIVWLRGGGAAYHLQGPNGINHVVNTYYSGYTAANGSFFGVRTNTSNVESEILSRYPIRGNGDGQIYISNSKVLYENTWIGSKYFGTDGSIYGTVFYDSNNSAYKVDPTGASNLSDLYANQFFVNGDYNGIRFNSGASSDLVISCIPGTRTFEIRNGNGPSPNYGACGLITGYATFTSSITVSSGNATGGGIILADDGDIVDLNDGYCAMRFSYGVRIHAGNRTGGAVHTLHSNGTFTATGDVVAYSDRRVKENIETIEDALGKVTRLRGVTYNRTDKEDKTQKIGVIAQEIQEVLPQVVFEQEDGMLGVSYGNITAVLIEAIKEQQTQIEELKELVNKLINK
jgi:hypothetical protein